MATIINQQESTADFMSIEELEAIWFDAPCDDPPPPYISSLRSSSSDSAASFYSADSIASPEAEPNSPRTSVGSIDVPSRCVTLSEVNDFSHPAEDSSKPMCWGAELRGDNGAGCTPGFTLGKTHFRTKFCKACLHGTFDLPATCVRAVRRDQCQKSDFGNNLRAGFWKRATDGADARLANNTITCDGPWLVLYREPPQSAPSTQAWVETPSQWVQNGIVRLAVKEGTLVPAVEMARHNGGRKTRTASDGGFDGLADIAKRRRRLSDLVPKANQPKDDTDHVAAPKAWPSHAVVAACAARAEAPLPKVSPPLDEAQSGRSSAGEMEANVSAALVDAVATMGAPLVASMVELAFAHEQMGDFANSTLSGPTRKPLNAKEAATLFQQLNAACSPVLPPSPSSVVCMDEAFAAAVDLEPPQRENAMRRRHVRSDVRNDIVEGSRTESSPASFTERQPRLQITGSGFGLLRLSELSEEALPDAATQKSLPRSGPDSRLSCKRGKPKGTKSLGAALKRMFIGLAPAAMRI